MARDLYGTIRDIFRTDLTNSCIWESRNRPHNSSIKYMEISLQQQVFEIPVFAFKSFADMVASGADAYTDAIAVVLNTKERIPSYKTVDRYMRDILTESFKHSRLILLEVKQGDITHVYYGTGGAVFDEFFNPIMMCSYQMQRFDEVVPSESDLDNIRYVTKYRFLRPILRIDPDVYLRKGDSMGRFLAGKLVNTCLDTAVYYPYRNALSDRFELATDSRDAFVKVEIDKCPFDVHTADTPSISTSNQQLLQLAIDHIDEIIQ